MVQMHQVVARGGSRWVLLLVLVSAGFLGLALDGSLTSADSGGTDPSSGLRPAVRGLLDGAVAVPGLATGRSQTYRRPDGTLLTRVFAQSSGVDSTLEATARGYAAEGDGATTTFPA